MGFFSKIVQSTIDVALTPVEIVKDVVTMGGLNTDQDETYTVQRLRKIKRHAEEAYDSLDD